MAGLSPYFFDHSAGGEVGRLAEQARVIDPGTERLFREAGIATGMRVLDLGSGAGDVTLLAARIVGPQGTVAGLDSSPEAILAARDRAARAGIGNVEFVQSDLLALGEMRDAAGGPFDAVVGRLVLEFMPDPSQVLRQAARLVKPGGIVCFQEVDNWYTWAYPETGLWARLRNLFMEALTRSGIEPRMGLLLYQTFTAAGLAEPRLRLEAAIAGGQDAPVAVWANLIRGALPAMERLGLAEARSIDPGSLADRLLADVRAHNGVVIAPVMIGAWACTPQPGTH
jgi:ubiquinone/menaquinone biosynthesis C-methylase UbiE